MAAKESSRNDLQRLIEAIKATDTVELRVQLLSELGDLELRERSDLTSLVDCLTTFWEDFTCLDISQCSLNKTILQLAAKHVNSDLSECLPQFLNLVTKACSWCGKHLKMALMSTGDSQEDEHFELFFQLLLGFLSFSVETIITLMRSHVFSDKIPIESVQGFVLQLLNLTKDLISEIKKLDSFASEVLRHTQAVIDAIMKLCKEYTVAINFDTYDAIPEKEGSGKLSEKVNIGNYVKNIIKSTTEKLYELGILAASDGGSLVAILNVSWKGVVILLQLAKKAGILMIRVEDIILSLISLVTEPLRCAAEAWSSLLKEPIAVSDARRTFLPVKFYLINAMKITSLCPCQTFLVYREVTLAVLLLSTFGILLSYENLLSTANEVFSELLEKASVELLSSLLNSSELKQEHKYEIIDFIFMDDCCSTSTHEDSVSGYSKPSLVEIFSVSCEAMLKARKILLGRVALFLSMLRYSAGITEDIRIKLIQKLGWLLNVLVDEEMYSFMIDLQIPVIYGSGKTVELAWHPMFSALLHSLKAFMVIVSSGPAWVELEAFLLENLFHPHLLCQELITELWCFKVRHAETDMLLDLFDKLCSVMELLASPDAVLVPNSPLRKMARVICLLLANAPSSVVENVYTSVVGDGKSPTSSVMFAAMLLEGFPLNSLSENAKSMSKERIVTNYFGFIGAYDEMLKTNSGTGAFGIPVFTTSAALLSRQVSISDVDLKTLKFIITIIHKFRNPSGEDKKEYCEKILNEILMIISNMNHLYKTEEMEEVILELENLFISKPGAADLKLLKCKPYLALFVGGLGEMKLSESEDCVKSVAVWNLYHLLFRERHWALVHLAIRAFGYFAARTSSNQLWRFVPQDATLAYDLMSGNEANEEGFMFELKAYLEKEMAVPNITPSLEQLNMLIKEGMVLKERVQRIPDVCIEAMEIEKVETDITNHSNKRRKLPDGIGKGVELLQSGLKAISYELSKWQQNQFEPPELHDKFLAHFSCLEDVVSHLTSLAGVNE